MFSFESLQRLKTTAAVLVLAAVAAPGNAVSQPAKEFAANEGRQRQLVEKIQRIRSEEGLHSPGLIGPLEALALLHEDRAEHALAAATIARALQVVRVNYGLYSLEQAPLLRQSIRNAAARGDAAGAWNTEQELLALVGKNPDDLRTVPVLREIADERMDLLRQYAAGDHPPEIAFGCYYEGGQRKGLSAFAGSIGECTAGSRNVAMRSILEEAQRYYTDAAGVLRRHELYSSPDLRQLEMNIVRSSYRYRDYQLPSADSAASLFPARHASDGAYVIGRDSLRRLLRDETRSSAPLLNRMLAYIRVADWNLLFRKYAAALDMYAHAYEQLRQHGMPQASIDRIFSPDTPVVIPTFIPDRLASDATGGSRGYIDVVFDVTKFGTSRHVRILDTTTNATRTAKHRLIHLIWSSRFRPRMKDGRFVTAKRIVMRYYLND